MKPLLEVLQLSSDYLQGKVQNPRRSAEELIAFVLGCKRMDLYLESEKPLVESELEKIRECIRRRARNEPVEYITGSLEFYKCQIKVTKNVLIPRVETELLVDLIVNQLKQDGVEGNVLFDICTGSGCIGIALKKVFPDLRVILSDLSEEALGVAKENAKINQADVEFRSGDLFGPFAERAHYVVSNPPYVSQVEYEDLSPDVKNFEPARALCSGSTGLEFYERFAKDLPSFLFPHGKVFFEIGATQAKDVQKLFLRPNYPINKILQDLAGLDRFFFLEFE